MLNVKAIANDKNKGVTANVNIYPAAARSSATEIKESVLMISVSVVGILSLVVDGVSSALNSGDELAANTWYMFTVPIIFERTYTIKHSKNAIAQIYWYWAEG